MGYLAVLYDILFSGHEQAQSRLPGSKFIQVFVSVRTVVPSDSRISAV